MADASYSSAAWKALTIVRDRKVAQKLHLYETGREIERERSGLKGSQKSLEWGIGCIYKLLLGRHGVRTSIFDWSFDRNS